MIYIIGIGMGNENCLTLKAKTAIEESTLIIGAKRMLSPYEDKKNTFCEYRADKIAEKIRNSNDKNIAVLFSGDTGFYSGAKRLTEILEKDEYEIIAGVSSISYFCSRLGISYDDAVITSIHGVKNNAIGYIKRNKRVFILLGGNDDIEMICTKLKKYSIQALLTIGTRLSYDDEKIVTLNPYDAKVFNFDMPAVMLAENEAPIDMSFSSINDDEFIRGNVPMTKSEIRSICIAKMCLKRNSIVYDIGAGTGSVSIESALRVIDGTVYAIEKNETALELIEKNKIKFSADNIEIIKGSAPEITENLPAPTHVFIGGSSGNIEDIISLALQKNSNVKIVITAVSLNTVSDIMRISEKKRIDFEVTQISSAKSEKIGKYLMMKGQNPIYIFCSK